MSTPKGKPGTGQPEPTSKEQITNSRSKKSPESNAGGISSDSKRSNDSIHNDSGYDTNGHQGNDWRDNSSDSADSFGKSRDNQPKSANTKVKDKVTKKVLGRDNFTNNADARNAESQNGRNDSKETLSNGRLDGGDSGNQSEQPASKRERAKTARPKPKPAPNTKIPSTAREAEVNEPVTLNGSVSDRPVRPTKEGGSTGSLRSKASEGAGDKKVSFKDDYSPDRSSGKIAVNNQKVSNSSENSTGKKSAMNTPGSSRSDSYRDGPDSDHVSPAQSDNVNMRYVEVGQLTSRETSRNNDQFTHGYMESPRSDGEATIWRKYPSEARVQKSNGVDGREYDSLSLESVRSARMTTRDDLDYSPMGRKFTRKLTKTKFG